MGMLIFETHATSLDNDARLASGWYDVDLSPAGERQAGEMGDRYRDVSIGAVYCSDLLRARRTADIAFAERRHLIRTDARLRECDYGDLSRAPADTIEQRRLACIDMPFPNGESYRQVVGRVGEYLAELYRHHRDETVVVVGHRATYYALEHLLAGIPLDEAIASPWRWQAGWPYTF